MAEDPTPQPKSQPVPEPVVTPAAAKSAPSPAVVPVPDVGYTPEGVPTLEGVREKIETRFGTALGATELAEETPEAKTATQQFETRQKAAEHKLEEIRASMHKPDGATAPPG